ncbi:MAG: copper chaperone PCu(A)C [Gammaproteobacteria bacterium]|nr:copper chaperone PCu(A)C [Gammaproteobacteria bacterium]
MIIKLLIATLLSIPSIAFADLIITNAWVKNAPSVVPVRAAYMSFINNGNDTVIIDKITSKEFKFAEAHETIDDDGILKMVEIKPLTIAPNSTVKFEPFGKHIMLITPKKSLLGLTSINITVVTKNKQTIKLIAPIKNTL